MRYWFVPKGFDILREEIQTVRARHYRRLLDQCGRYFRESLPEEHPAKSITYYGIAAGNLALCWKLSGQRRFLEEAIRWIFAGVRYPHWGVVVKKDVDLSAAWLLFWYGLCYNWLREDLPEALRREFLDKLILQGGRMFDYAAEAEEKRLSAHRGEVDDVLTGHSWVTAYWQNHNWIDMAGLAMAGYAIAEEHPAAERWTALARENFLKVFPLLPEDGSDYEGVVYWRYGVIWLFQYAQLLREAEGIDLFAQSKFLRNTFYYRLYQCGPDLEQNFNFGDCHDRRSGHTAALYYKTAAEYGDGHAQWLAERVLTQSLFREGHQSDVKPGILPEACLELLWYDPSVKPLPVDTLPKTRFFPDLGLLSFRTGWDAEATAFSWKCSSGGGEKQWRLSHEVMAREGVDPRSMGHHHPDANSFLLLRGSDYLAVDEGYANKNETRHHNLILVDGMGYEGDGQNDVYACLTRERTAEVEQFFERDGVVYARGEAHRLYRSELGLTRLAREVLVTPRGCVVLRDVVESEREHIYTWLLHTDNEPVLRGGEWQVESGLSRLRVKAPGTSLREETGEMSVSSYFTSQEPDNIVTTRMKTLELSNRMPEKRFELITVLLAESVFDAPEASTLICEQMEEGIRIRAGGEEISFASGIWRVRSGGAETTVE